MKCMSCKGGEMKPDTTTYFAQLNNCYVIIENVPCLKCKQCGEEFLNTVVAEKIDDILDSFVVLVPIFLWIEVPAFLLFFVVTILYNI